ENKVGEPPAEHQGAEQQRHSYYNQSAKWLLPFEKQPHQRDERQRAAQLADDERGEIAMTLDPGGGERAEQSLLLGNSDDRARGDQPAEPGVPARAARS